jgi:uncharacterized protein YpbB
VSTVVALISSLIESGETEFKEEWMDPEHYRQIAEACQRLGTDLLRPIKECLPEEISFDEVRLVASHLRRLEKSHKPQAP